jgi:uncharacterized protein
VFHVLNLTYLQPDEVVDQSRPAHLEWLAAEVAAGRVLLAGRLDGVRGAVLVTGDISAEEADAVIAGDPYTQAGAARYERSSFTAGFRAPGI